MKCYLKLHVLHVRFTFTSFFFNHIHHVCTFLFGFCFVPTFFLQLNQLQISWGFPPRSFNTAKTEKLKQFYTLLFLEAYLNSYVHIFVTTRMREQGKTYFLIYFSTANIRIYCRRWKERGREEEGIEIYEVKSLRTVTFQKSKG